MGGNACQTFLHLCSYQDTAVQPPRHWLCSQQDTPVPRFSSACTVGRAVQLCCARSVNQQRVHSLESEVHALLRYFCGLPAAYCAGPDKQNERGQKHLHAQLRIHVGFTQF